MRVSDLQKMGTMRTLEGFEALRYGGDKSNNAPLLEMGGSPFMFGGQGADLSNGALSSISPRGTCALFVSPNGCS